MESTMVFSTISCSAFNARHAVAVLDKRAMDLTWSPNPKLQRRTRSQCARLFILRTAMEKESYQPGFCLERIKLCSKVRLLEP